PAGRVVWLDEPFVVWFDDPFTVRLGERLLGNGGFDSAECPFGPRSGCSCSCPFNWPVVSVTVGAPAPAGCAGGGDCACFRAGSSAGPADSDWISLVRNSTIARVPP